MVTQFFLTDALGSVLASFSDTANSATVLGNQVYGPYGNQRYLKGSMGTAKGYTGQYADPTGLDYYNVRYYDPVAGVFLSADTKQGNVQGMNPYAYVAGNPETFNDPSGQYVAGPGVISYYPGAPYYIASGGQAVSVQTGKPYNQGGYKNGWLLTQGPNAKSTTSQPTTRPNPKSVTNRPGCDVSCVNHDKKLIKQYWAKQDAQEAAGWKVPEDISQLLMDVGTIMLDYVGGSLVAAIYDFFTGAVPHLAALVNDVALALNGTVPDGLKMLLSTFQILTGFFNAMKGFMFFLGGIGELVSPVLSLAKTQVVSIIASGLLSMGNGSMTLLQGSSQQFSNHENLDDKTPEQIHDLCIGYGLMNC